MSWKWYKPKPTRFNTDFEYRLFLDKGIIRNIDWLRGLDDEIVLYPSFVTPTRLVGVIGTGVNFWYTSIDVPAQGRNGAALKAHWLRTGAGDFDGAGVDIQVRIDPIAGQYP